MKTPPLLFLLLCLAGPLQGAGTDEAPPREFARLETTRGVVYEAVKVTKAEPDGLRISHKHGVAKVPFLELKDFKIAVQYGYDFVEAGDFQLEQEAKAAAEKEAAEEAAMDKASADRRSRQRAARTDADQKLVAGLDRRAVRVKMDAFQNSTVGLIGTARVGTVGRWEEKPGSMANTVPVWVWQGKADAVLSGFKAATVATSISRYGLTRDFLEWDGKAWEIGTVTYTTVTGASRTVRHFTADRAKAAAYFRGR